MNISYDPKADALYIQFRKGNAKETLKIKDGLLFLELVQPSGKEPMTGEEFFRGHKK